jgi:DNA replication protein DnaC
MQTSNLKQPTPKFKEFKTFGEAALELALTACRDFVTNIKASPSAGHALSLLGQSGVGKTMLAHCVWNELQIKNGYCMAIESRTKIGKNGLFHDGKFYPLTARWRDWRKVSDGFKAGMWGQVESMEESGILFLDDIGSDYDPNLIAASKLDRILRSRVGKWTILNSNLSLAQIAEKLDTRIASFLIRDKNICVEIQAKDFAFR